MTRADSGGQLQRPSSRAQVGICRRRHGTAHLTGELIKRGRKLGGRKVTDSASFCTAALETARVNVVPGSAFGDAGAVTLFVAAADKSERTRRRHVVITDG